MFALDPNKNKNVLKTKTVRKNKILLKNQLIDSFLLWPYVRQSRQPMSI